jgi:hypothetical protein
LRYSAIPRTRERSAKKIVAGETRARRANAGR